MVCHHVTLSDWFWFFLKKIFISQIHYINYITFCVMQKKKKCNKSNSIKLWRLIFGGVRIKRERNSNALPFTSWCRSFYTSFPTQCKPPTSPTHLHTYTIYTIYTSTPPKPQQTKNKKHTAALTPSASREL